MAKVATAENVASIAPARDPGVRASPADFGAQIGGAMQGFASTLGALAEARKNLEEQRQAFTDASAISDTELGLVRFSEEFLARENERAGSGLPDEYTAAYGQKRQELLADMAERGITLSEKGRQRYELMANDIQVRYTRAAVARENNEQIARGRQMFEQGADALVLGVAQGGDLAAAEARLDASLEVWGATGGLPPSEIEAMRAAKRREMQAAYYSRLPPDQRPNLLDANAPGGGQTQSTETGSVSAPALLRKFEGFRDTAYWDVNAYRTGYGSDTVTRADGTIEKVTKDTVITREDAERDLARRTKEFEAEAAAQVGISNWRRLPANTRAALVSVAYNYGKLPGTVVRAVYTGGAEDIASAVEGLSANPDRRKQEATVIRGGVIAGENGVPVDRYDALTYADRVKLQREADNAFVKEWWPQKQAEALQNISLDTFEDTISEVESTFARKFGAEKAKAVGQAFRAEAAQILIDRQISADPAGIESILSTDVIKAGLPPDKIDAARADAGKALKAREDGERAAAWLSSIDNNRQIYARARGLPSYKDKDGELVEAGPPMSLDEIDVALSGARLAGAHPEQIRVLEQLREVIKDRPGTSEGKPDVQVFVSLSERMAGLFDKKGKAVLDDSSVTEIVRLQADIIEASRRGQISGNQAQTMLTKIVPALTKQVDRESGGGWILGMGGGPKDIYDHGFGEIQRLLEESRREDDTALKASMFSAFITYADAANLDKIEDRARAAEAQRGMANFVSRAYLKYLTGQDFEELPGKIILDTGEIVNVGSAMAGKTASSGTHVALARGAKLRIERGPDGRPMVSIQRGRSTPRTQIRLRDLPDVPLNPDEIDALRGLTETEE